MEATTVDDDATTAKRSGASTSPLSLHAQQHAASSVFGGCFAVFQVEKRGFNHHRFPERGLTRCKRAK